MPIDASTYRKYTIYLNIMNKESKYDNLIIRYPDLIKKSDEICFGIGEGWYNIIDALCCFISSDVTRARYELNYALKHPESKFVKPVPELEARLAKALEDLPTIVQVKEKFGGLRFYIDGGTHDHNIAIGFAEYMAARTCEVCGAPGESINSDWIRTLCPEHAKQQNTAGTTSPEKI